MSVCLCRTQSEFDLMVFHFWRIERNPQPNLTCMCLYFDFDVLQRGDDGGPAREPRNPALDARTDGLRSQVRAHRAATVLADPLVGQEPCARWKGQLYLCICGAYYKYVSME